MDIWNAIAKTYGIDVNQIEPLNAPGPSTVNEAYPGYKNLKRGSAGDLYYKGSTSPRQSLPSSPRPPSSPPRQTPTPYEDFIESLKIIKLRFTNAETYIFDMLDLADAKNTYNRLLGVYQDEFTLIKRLVEATYTASEFQKLENEVDALVFLDEDERSRTPVIAAGIPVPWGAIANASCTGKNRQADMLFGNDISKGVEFLEKFKSEKAFGKLSALQTAMILLGSEYNDKDSIQTRTRGTIQRIAKELNARFYDGQGVETNIYLISLIPRLVPTQQRLFFGDVYDKDGDKSENYNLSNPQNHIINDNTKIKLETGTKLSFGDVTIIDITEPYTFKGNALTFEIPSIKELQVVKTFFYKNNENLNLQLPLLRYYVHKERDEYNEFTKRVVGFGLQSDILTLRDIDDNILVSTDGLGTYNGTMKQYEIADSKNVLVDVEELYTMKPKATVNTKNKISNLLFYAPFGVFEKAPPYSTTDEFASRVVNIISNNPKVQQLSDTSYGYFGVPYTPTGLLASNKKFSGDGYNSLDSLVSDEDEFTDDDEKEEYEEDEEEEGQWTEDEFTNDEEDDLPSEVESLDDSDREDLANELAELDEEEKALVASESENDTEEEEEAAPEHESDRETDNEDDDIVEEVLLSGAPVSEACHEEDKYKDDEGDLY